MKLADVISAMHWTVFAEIALVIAFAGFVAVVASTFLARNRVPFERARHLPLSEDAADPQGAPVMSPDRDRRLGHDYDGIEEYDNPLPGWWSWIFVATIVFSVGYWLYYQVGPGPTIIAQYERDMREHAERAAKLAPPPAAGADEDTLRGLAKDARVMATARSTFATRCVPCHGPEGQGTVGPNLTDDYWIHGRSLVQIRRTISEGVPDKGMVPWKDQLKPDEIAALAAYVGTLRGTNPPNPKPPQGVNSKGEQAPAGPTASQ